MYLEGKSALILSFLSSLFPVIAGLGLLALAVLLRSPRLGIAIIALICPTTNHALGQARPTFHASQEGGALSEWHGNSVSGTGSSVGVVSAADEGIPEIDGRYVVKAILSGRGSGFARTHFVHSEAGVPTWGEGTDVRYSAVFYLPRGFYKARAASSNDLMRWDAHVDGERDIQGGLGINRADKLKIMSNYPYTQPLTTSYQIPEGKWTRVEVHQTISQHDGTALNEIYVNGALVGSSRVANYKGSAYPNGERAINRLRFGLVSEGRINQTLSLYFDRARVSINGRIGQPARSK